MQRCLLILGLILLINSSLSAQGLQFGMETTVGKARTTFKGDLAGIIGFSEFEISDDDVDEALANAGINAPNWLKRLFPGIRLDVDQEISRQLSRNVQMVRVFAQFKWVGASFSLSDPRLIEQRESEKFKNQLKAARLSVNGDAEGLAEHLALMALADVDKPTPFFDNRYDVEAYLHVKQLFLGSDPLVIWGRNERGSLDIELTTGIRFSADPSPVVDLGNVLFISEKIDDIMEGGLLDPLEDTTDAIAEAIQNLVFGKFKDPRTVPSRGWFLRTTVPISFGGGFSVVAGGEYSLSKHTSISGTKPMHSFYGFAGVRWAVQAWGNQR
jgi:hypothetical protein